MDLIDLINAAYASVLDDGDLFMGLVDEAERSYQDQDGRLEMTSEALARTYNL